MTFFTKLMVVLRVFQVFCSLVDLGCGAYITYVLLSLNSDIATLNSDIDTALSLSDLSSKDQSFIREVLGVLAGFFTGAPIGAYILSGVSILSLGVIVYVLVAQSTSKHPRLNKRSIIIPLEVFTAAAWVVALVSVTLFASKYSVVCLPYDLFLNKLRPLDTILEKFPILDHVLPSCTLDIVAAVAAGLACFLFCVTTIAGCCMDRYGNCCGARGKKGNAHQEAGFGEVSESGKPDFVAAFEPIGSEQKGSLQIPLLQGTPAPQYESPPSQNYTPVSQDISPQSKYCTSPNKSWGR